MLINIQLSKARHGIIDQNIQFLNKLACSFIDPKRKVLTCGSVQTGNLPTRSHEPAKQERRTLSRTDPVMSPPSPPQQNTQLRKCTRAVNGENLDPWKIDTSYESEIKFEQFDTLHCLQKDTAVVNSTIEFTVLVYNCPLAENHVIYQERKRSIRYHYIHELLDLIDCSCLCTGLPDNDDDVKSVAVDTTSQCSTPGTILRHSISFHSNVPTWSISLHTSSLEM